MKKQRIWLILALALLLLPGGALAADGVTAPAQTITLEGFQDRLNGVLRHLERAGSQGSTAGRTAELRAARDLLAGTWQVETPAGSFRADLRPLEVLIDSGEIPAATELVRQYLQAAGETAASELAPPSDVRERLNLVLAELKARGSFTRWLTSQFMRLFSPLINRDVGRQAEAARPYLLWGSLAVGLVGVVLLGRGLLRSLTGHAGVDDAAAEARRQAGQRLMTPEELWQDADRLAQAGEYREALRTLHLAVLKRYDRLGLLRYLPAATNREHERLLHRLYPDLARLMHPLNDLTEARLYSGQDASADDYRQARAWGERLWREGDAASKSHGETGGPLSSASSP